MRRFFEIAGKLAAGLSAAAAVCAFATFANAQTVAVDLDQLSKIAYCAGQMDAELELKQRRHYCEVSGDRCQTQRERLDRFTAYVASRLIVSPNAAFAATVAREAGKADFDACVAAGRTPEWQALVTSRCSADRFKGDSEQMGACIDKLEKPQPCQRGAVCATRELPY
jgi:hypothetical protein